MTERGADTMTADTGNANCRELLDVMTARGLDTVVVSPGSRNAPLLIGVSARDELRKIIIPDERTAAFAALGIGLVTRRPVALACTSGTALYNYAPAVAEAYYQKIPLIVITADRPSQWIDQDDSQTLRQPGALDKIVKRSYDIPPETGMTSACTNPEYRSEREWFVNRIANEAYTTATSGQPGPVHVNMQFGNPLDETTLHSSRQVRTVEVIPNDAPLPPQLCRDLALRLIDKKIMVTAGFMGADNELNKALTEFSRLPNVTVICETISNLHLGGHAFMADTLFTGIEKERLDALRPDVVISVGGALVSRMLKEYLRGCTGAEHWTLSDTDVSTDCFQRLSLHVDYSPRRFFKGIASMTRHLVRKGHGMPGSGYRDAWQSERDRIFEDNRRRLAETPWSELTALARVFASVPDNYNLFLSNGTCVRYAQLLTDRIPHATYCNRGVSGIDGTNATALGVSMAYKGTTLLVTGDMSFAYCPEVMHLQKLAGGDLRTVVVSNGGGGIFRFIKTTRRLETREKYFCCDQKLPVGDVARAYGWNYRNAHDMESLAAGLEYLYETPSTLLEITVDPETSAETLIRWMERHGS
ncbi:MAG: 2-succinyl-5-enolpyruvyl-6-hydroxy-3-cyclohexene-1-carboxylic-acid synthase [Muribaculaceae bacterium]|nr:2-succinyl-5-enolpyruvyl-6-hydroxy-3-cyclohexene-1-carboxylic-acid synthase [Muribaculaceae bacterium]